MGANVKKKIKSTFMEILINCMEANVNITFLRFVINIIPNTCVVLMEFEVTKDPFQRCFIMFW